MDVQGAEAAGLTAAVRERFVIGALQLMIHSLVGLRWLICESNLQLSPLELYWLTDHLRWPIQPLALSSAGACDTFTFFPSDSFRERDRG